MIDRTQTTLPCPDWCDLGAGHGFHSTDPESGALVRDHTRDFGPHVSLCVEEFALSETGPAWSETTPFLHVADNVTNLGVGDAALLLADLTEATSALRALL